LPTKFLYFTLSVLFLQIKNLNPLFFVQKQLTKVMKCGMQIITVVQEVAQDT